MAISGVKKYFGTLPQRLAVTLVFSVLASCGGGGADSSPSAPAIGAANPPAGGVEQPLPAHDNLSLSAKQDFSDDEVRHFLARTHFGIEPGKTGQIQLQGLAVYIDQMMDFPAPGAQSYEITANQLLINEDDPAGLEGKFPGNSDILDWNIHLLINNPNAFQEVMGMFWQDHFGVDFKNFRSEEDHLMVEFVNMLRDRGVDNYRNLLLDVSRHGAMLLFLDGADNSKFAPNENYAREFWELYTLGVDNGYTENDVIEASRAFTGWRRKFNAGTGLAKVVFDPESKAVGSKQPLGNHVGHELSNDDYGVMVDITIAHTNAAGVNLVAEYISTKLLKYFYSEDPAPELVAGFTAVLQQNNLDIGPSLKTLFLSEAFYAAEGREGLVRDFYEQVVGLVRTTGLTESAYQYRRYLTAMDSLPGRPPSVEGWPEGDDKINSQGSGVEMPNFVNELITNRNNQQDQGYDIGAALQPVGATGAGDVVAHLAQLLGVTLDDTERSALVDFMNVEINSAGEETPVTYTPQNVDHQSRKLRNLLWILCQHPSFHIK